jgi:hypothetical protein
MNEDRDIRPGDLFLGEKGTSYLILEPDLPDRVSSSCFGCICIKNGSIKRMIWEIRWFRTSQWRKNWKLL